MELPLVAAGQPQAIPRFTSGVDVVQFTVTVLDKDRHPITGLAADDFEVLVDGKPKPLAAFAAVTLPDEAPHAVARVPSIPVDVQTNELPSEGRVVVIVLDRSTPTGQPMRAARDVANAAIDRLGPADLGAVVFTARGMKRYSQGLTADRTRLHAAVAAALNGAGEEPGEKIPIAGGMDKGTNAAAAAEGGGSGGGGGPQTPARAEKPANRMPLVSEDDSGECYCGVCVPDDLTSLAQTLSRAPGRYKSVLFIGSDIALSSRDPTSRCAAVIQPARERLSRYEVRAGVATPDGTRAASVYGDVDVPDVATLGLAISGVVVKSGGAATVQRTFDRGAAIGLSFQVAQSKDASSPPSVTYSLRDETGRPIEKLAVPHDRAVAVTDRIAAYDIGVRLPAAADRYVVTIEAKDGRRTARRDVLVTLR